MLPYSRRALLDVNQTNALRVADAYAAVRVLADGVASLPPKVYRRTSAWRRFHFAPRVVPGVGTVGPTLDRPPAGYVPD